MRYYFLGIAGTAMASLAALLKMKGHQVWGTDQGIYPPMSDFLAGHQITVHKGYDKKHLSESIDMVVIGNALSRGNEEVEVILNSKLPFVSLPQLIHDEFVRNHDTIAVTGTHGKTSITAMLSWIFDTASLSPTFLIGGISRNFSSSIQLGSGKYFIIEGDEYDSAFFDKRPKFLHYFPKYLIINNIEFDHADIYADLNSIKNEFSKLLRIIPGKGLVVANGNDPAVREVVEKTYSRLQTFGMDSAMDWSYRNLHVDEMNTNFDLLFKEKLIDSFTLSQPGEHQVKNAIAAMAIAHDAGIDWNIIKKALATFRGVKRRLEFWGKINGALVFDDFAHHPTAIEATLRVVKQVFPQKRIVALFEPRTNTTVTNILQKELMNALSIADSIFIAPLHRPERVPPEKRISLSEIIRFLSAQNKLAVLLESYSQIPKFLSDNLTDDDVLVLLTNGSFGGQYVKIREMVKPGE